MSQYLAALPGRTIEINEQPKLNFGGTSYLGLQTDSDFQSLFAENIKRIGTAFGSSRNANIRLSVFEEAETALAAWAESPASLTLSSGFLAGQFLARQLNTETHRLFHAPKVHPASQRENSQAFQNAETLVDAIQRHLSSNDPRTPTVFFDTIDFAGGPYASPLWLEALPLDRVALVADDSHGLGIMGRQGGGAYSPLAAKQPKLLFVYASLAKACALPGGVIFGPSAELAAWTASSFFAGASPMMPAALASFLQSKSQRQMRLERLRENIERFAPRSKKLEGLKQTKGHPAFTLDDKELERRLKASGIVFTHFPYPQDSSPKISRVILSAHHRATDIDALANALDP